MNKLETGWYVTRRWQEFEGEIRAAILRVVLVTLFYAIQLWNFFVFTDRAGEALTFHRSVTFLAGAWLCISLVVLVALRQRFFPSWLKFATTAGDLVLLTGTALVGSGPASPLVVCYFLLIALAALRCSLPLVWFVTLGAICCYWALVGAFDESWFDAEHVTQPVQQLVVGCSMVAMGFTVGQLIRMYQSVATAYATRLGIPAEMEATGVENAVAQVEEGGAQS